MPSKSRGADALVASLSAAKVRRIFALSGNHVMPVFDAAIDAGIELIHVRHEAAAVHMADAWARLTGEAGAALVTGGPGHAPHDEMGRGAFQEMRQADIAAPLCKSSWTCRAASEVALDVEKAISIAKGGRPGPVHVSLPTDVLEGRTADESGRARPENDLRQVDRMPAAELDPAPILERLKKAQRPLILCGPAAGTKRGRERLRVLEVAIGVPAVCMESPRGVADPSLGVGSLGRAG